MKHRSAFLPGRGKVGLVTRTLFVSHIVTMLESSPDMLAMSARILACLPRRLGATILTGLERGDRLTERSGRAAGHSAALRCLFSTSAPIDPQVSRRAVWSHVRWVYDSLAGLGGRGFQIDWRGADRLEEAARRGEPLLIVTAHVGNWLIAAEACTGRLGPIETVAGVQLRATWDDSIRRHLAERGIVLHRPGAAYRRFLERLKKGGTVALHLDGTPSPAQNPRRGGDNPEPGGCSESSESDHRSSVSAPLGVRAAARLIRATNPRVFGVVSRRTGPDLYTLYVEDLPEADEGVLLDYLRRQVRFDPSEWLIFRSEHLGGVRQ